MRKHFILLTLVAVIGCSSADEKRDIPTESGAEVSTAEAKRIYTMKCGLCHGADGKLMVAGAPDLSKSRLSLDDRIALVTYGKGAMPPQRGILSSAEIRAVAKYIEDFRD